MEQKPLFEDLRPSEIVSIDALKVIARLIKYQPMISVFQECEALVGDEGSREVFREIAEIIRKFKK